MKQRKEAAVCPTWMAEVIVHWLAQKYRPIPLSNTPPALYSHLSFGIQSN